jgi:hypothetical protein
MKRLMALVVCAGMMWGCGKKSPTQAGGGGTESVEVASAATSYSTNDSAWVVTYSARFNASPSKSCRLDSIYFEFPDSSGTWVTLKHVEGNGNTILVGGETTPPIGTVIASEWAWRQWGWPRNAGHGTYHAIIWGSWDGVRHQSPVYSWAW